LNNLKRLKKVDEKTPYYGTKKDSKINLL